MYIFLGAWLGGKASILLGWPGGIASFLDAATAFLLELLGGLPLPSFSHLEVVCRAAYGRLG